jgi:hypothetical protein
LAAGDRDTVKGVISKVEKEGINVGERIATVYSDGVPRGVCPVSL